MLTIATNSGSFQYTRHEHIRIRFQCNSTIERMKVADCLWEGDSIGIKFGPGDEVKPSGYEWLTVQAVSWNAAWDRRNEAERAQRKAEREAEKTRQEASELDRLDATISSSHTLVALAEELLAKGLVAL